MNFGSMISVIAQPQLYIATDLTGITLDEHIKFTWLKLWAVNILVVLFGIVTGVFMPKRARRVRDCDPSRGRRLRSAALLRGGRLRSGRRERFRQVARPPRAGPAPRRSRLPVPPA